PALSDDSGLEVDALDGRPGVYSARFAGPDASDADNLRKLVDELRDVPDNACSARYRCVIALVRAADDDTPLLARGTWEGRIVRVARGDGGFGYDPVFVPTGESRTVAEMPLAEKNVVSHRALALRALLAQWPRL
ncbi:non-canonical purine NTP pyrophosphatase, partial [bacterium]